MGRIIQRDRSIVPACDVLIEVFRDIVKSTGAIEEVGAYKIGTSFLDIGLRATVDTAREFTEKPIIYDHQKAATDIHEVSPDNFMDAMVRARVNAVILFPESGPVTEYEWIKAAQNRGLGVIVGGEMTHPRYLEGDLSNSKKKNYTEIFRELGIQRDITGFIRSTAPRDMYELAARMGVTNFVVPGTKPDKIREYRKIIEECGVTDASYLSPGLIAQGGKPTEGAEAAGKSYHAIAGRATYFNEAEKRFNTPNEIVAAVKDISSQLN